MSRISDNRNIGLHALYSSKNISHRDISIDNFYFIKDGSMATCELIDREHASITGRRSSGDEIRTGTMTFMACEVSDRGSDESTDGYVHRLHHDLESVLYMCVWLAFGYTPRKGPRDGQLLHGWRYGSWRHIFVHKDCFLMIARQTNEVIQGIPERIHGNKCYQLHAAFRVAFIKNAVDMANYMTDLSRIPMDMQAAWKEKNAEPLDHTVYTTFPVIMKALGEEAKACTKDCCVLSTSKS